MIAEGRDITTAGLPDADVRILFVARSGKCLRRRTLELYGDATEEQHGDRARPGRGRDKADSAASEFMVAAPGAATVDPLRPDIEEVRPFPPTWTDLARRDVQQYARSV